MPKPVPIPGVAMDERGATHVCDLLSAEGRPEPPCAKSLYFIVLRGAMPGEMIRLRPGLAALGRSPENEVQIPDMSVSRRHASLMVDDEGHAWLTDLGSTNGTYLNTHRLAARQTVGLRDGDRLGFGPSFLMKFVRTDTLDERHHREMFERSVRDPLTGLYNRAYFLNQMKYLVHQTYLRGMGLGVVMLDIDHFKGINDNHGHDVGDAVLRHVATVLRNSTRANDLVARYGGEEFVAALPIASEGQAMLRADRMRTSLKHQAIAIRGRCLSVTGSFGVAFGSAARPHSIERLISGADRALYRAKSDGRDRVRFDGGDGDSRIENDPLLVSAAPDGAGLTTVDYEWAMGG